VPFFVALCQCLDNFLGDLLRVMHLR